MQHDIVTTAPTLLVTGMTDLNHNMPDAKREATPAPTKATPTFSKTMEYSAMIDSSIVPSPSTDKDDQRTTTGEARVERGIRRALKTAKVK